MTAMIDRRIFFKIAATGVAGCFFAPKLAAQAVTGEPATLLGTARNVIFIFLPGAPSQIDTFDLHVGSWTPADFDPTTINGIDWPGGLMTELAGQLALNRFSLIRSCQSTALVHSLVQDWAQIARSPTSATGSIAPNIGSVVALEMESRRQPGQKLPGFVSFSSGMALQSEGYFASQFAPFDVAAAANGLAGLTNPDGQTLFATRYNTLLTVDGTLRGPGSPYGTALDEMADFSASAQQMMYDNSIAAAFKFSFDDQVKYGNSTFGKSCLTARNLLQADLGVHYIQIDLGGWDNHQNIYQTTAGVYVPAKTLDSGLANLIADLDAIPGSAGGKSLLDETLIVVKGEFGRTVGNITNQKGRDHYFVHAALMAGGGVQGGRVIGATTPDAAFIQDPGWSQERPIYAEDIAATIYSALSIDYTTVRHDDPLGRGFEYIPTNEPYLGAPILELFQ